MRRFRFSAVGLFALGLVAAGCGPAEIKVITDGDRTYIQDQTGKRWEVTTAVTEYGFEATGFQYGLGPNAIRPLDDPQMIWPGDSGYPDDDDDTPVLGVEIGGDSRAYPIAVLSWREVANEFFGDTAVAVAYLPLVDLAAVYSRELDGDVLRIGASGWTYAWTFVLYDKQTETLWYHLEGDEHMTGISGAHEHRILPTYPSEKTTWRDWKSSHPDSGYLDFP